MAFGRDDLTRFVNRWLGLIWTLGGTLVSIAVICAVNMVFKTGRRATPNHATAAKPWHSILGGPGRADSTARPRKIRIRNASPIGRSGPRPPASIR